MPPPNVSYRPPPVASFVAAKASPDGTSETSPERRHKSKKCLGRSKTSRPMTARSRLLTDAHAHPTDDPRLTTKDGIAALVDRMLDVPLGRVCAMSSCSGDQELVKSLALQFHDRVKERQAQGKEVVKLTPCFGYHPWYSHTISLESPCPTKEEHYRTLFSPAGTAPNVIEEVEAVLPHLPEPRSLQDILSELRQNLTELPEAMLGEVGLDRAFRVPASKTAVKDQPSEQNLLQSEPSTNEHTLALRGKRLTSLTIPIQHQVAILEAQIGLAVELGRNVSMHSVKAGEATMTFFKECCRLHNGANGRGFRDIHVDLHSCSLSAELIQTITKTHSNVFVSFSTTINARQKSLRTQIAAVPKERLLVESDWHSAEDLAERNEEILGVAAPYVLGRGIQVESNNRRESDALSEDDLQQAAETFAQNWRRFERNGAVKQRDGQASDSEEEGNDEQHDGSYGDGPVRRQGASRDV